MSDFEAAKFDDELLSAYLDDELAAEERARVEERLAADPAARQLLEELRAVSRTMKELPVATLGADLRESVLRRAERAMLVSGEQAGGDSRTGDSIRERVAAFPIGRSKRAWFWAGAALAAGLLLMIFDRNPARDANLPEQVAQNKRDSNLVRNEPLPSLEFRATKQADEPLADRQEPAIAAYKAVPSEADAALAKKSPEMSLGMELARPAQTATAPSGGLGGAGGAGTVAQPQTGESVRGKEIDTGKDLLVVHVNMKPEAMRERAFDSLLLKNQIAIEEATEEPARSAAKQDVEVVVVEAVPGQLYKCLDEIKKDETNYLGVAVDDRLASSQRSLAETYPATDMKQYNRGVVPSQQQVELAPDNHYYFKAEQSQSESEPMVRDASGLAGQQFAEQPPQVRSRIHAENVTSPAPAAVPTGPTSTGGGNVLSSDFSGPASGTDSRNDFYAGAKLNVARRAIQQLKTKADTLQVLFVLTCPSHSPLESEAAAATPAPALPDSAAPAEGGLKSGE